MPRPKPILTVAVLVGAMLCSGASTALGGLPAASAHSKAMIDYVDIVPRIRQKFAGPVRLPSGLRTSEANGDAVFPQLLSADANGYEVIFAAEKDTPCEGQHVCSWGSALASDLPLDQDPSAASKPIVLAHGIHGQFRKSVCAAYCSEATITWSEAGFTYRLGMKAGSLRDLIIASNSAILTSR